MRSKVAFGLLIATMWACTSVSTAVSPASIETQRAQWTSHALTRYSFDYRVTGFFIAYAGKPIRIVVINGNVSSAQDLTTNQTMSGPLTQWPTIDSLFARASAAASAGTLRAIRYDPTDGYPSEIDLNGPPDASGSIFASNLQPLP